MGIPTGINGISVFLPTPSARRATFVHVDVRMKEWRFLPTPSARRATWQQIRPDLQDPRISTHALREEGDRMVAG